MNSHVLNFSNISGTLVSIWCNEHSALSVQNCYWSSFAEILKGYKEGEKKNKILHSSMAATASARSLALASWALSLPKTTPNSSKCGNGPL